MENLQRDLSSLALAVTGNKLDTAPNEHPDWPPLTTVPSSSMYNIYILLIGPPGHGKEVFAGLQMNC